MVSDNTDEEEFGSLPKRHSSSENFEDMLRFGRQNEAVYQQTTKQLGVQIAQADQDFIDAADNLGVTSQASVKENN